jgi:hypothetical protein
MRFAVRPSLLNRLAIKRELVALGRTARRHGLSDL